MLGRMVADMSSIMASPELTGESRDCPYCSFPLTSDSVTLWGRQRYHRHCVADVSPELLNNPPGESLCETLEFDQLKLRHFMAYLGGWYLICVLVFFGLPLGVLALPRMKNPWEGLLFILSFFGGGGLFFMFLQGCIRKSRLRNNLPRTVSFSGHVVVISTPEKVVEFPLGECKWSSGSIMSDETCWFTEFRRGIALYTPDGCIGCGHSTEFQRQLRAFLTLERVAHVQSGGCLLTALLSLAGAVIGATSGGVLGQIIAQLTGQHVWPGLLGLLGALDGGLGVLLYLTCTYEALQAARRRLNPWLLGLAYTAVALKIGLAAGSIGAALVSAANGALGILLGILCQRKISRSKNPR